MTTSFRNENIEKYNTMNYNLINFVKCQTFTTDCHRKWQQLCFESNVPLHSS